MGQYQQRIAYTADNYYKWPGTGSWNQGLQLGNTIWGGHNGFLRWRNVNVPNGATITSAYITLSRWYDSTLAIKNTIMGIDEDNTADYSGGDATGRATTTATVSWNPSSTWVTDVDQTSGDIKTIIQEIVDRAGWSSGNSLGIRIDDNGSVAGDYGAFTSYTSAGSGYAQLTINYSGTSPSSSVSPSSSPSLSFSASPSLSPSASVSASPSPKPPFIGAMKIAKPGINVLTTGDPKDFIFSSEYGTLKYFDKQALQLTIDANAGDITGKVTHTHNLGYYPFIEAFVNVYIGSSDGTYEYCPFAGAGATVTYDANYIIKENTIDFYGQIGGVSTSTWVFDFLVFIYKNDLGLS